jgi:hypothetical protein
MEVRNNTRFLIFTVILIALMGTIIYFFREHPMGADFSQFRVLNNQDVASPANFVGKRVVVRGKVSIADPKKYIDIAGQKNVIGYIEKKADANADINAKPSYVRFAATDFFIQMGDSRILVSGQPEQIIDSRNRVFAVTTPGQHIDMIRDGAEYSIFGTIGRDNAGNYVLFPYRVTFQDIQPVAKEAAELNRKMAFIQYLSIFAVVAAYVLALSKGGVFGPAESEENGVEKTDTADKADKVDKDTASSSIKNGNAQGKNDQGEA